MLTLYSRPDLVALINPTVKSNLEPMSLFRRYEIPRFSVISQRPLKARVFLMFTFVFRRTFE